jgi:hypothetical protein
MNDSDRNPHTLELERRSAAVTLSDMEMFLFPELIYALTLANILSPRLWAWREDPWFRNLEKARPYRRIVRLKQYIMDHYEFNLDLDTWGLTTKERELGRFGAFIEESTLARSNALFGYEGDKYYFDIDIRTHFGLDRYEGNVIPYWKTETVEAMDAFRHKPEYRAGAGECVSLSALYAAALFVVARIPLRDIFLMATPLHSQNYVDVDDGILTNNRRLITKAMWCNGTELSAQGRRALENERVTYVAHESGWVHTIYPDTTLAPEAWSRFSDGLRNFLSTAPTPEILCNFLRQHGAFQKRFQMRQTVCGCERYIGAERMFAYEHGSSYRVSDSTRAKLVTEIDAEEFTACCSALPGRLLLNDLEDYLREARPDLRKEEDRRKLHAQLALPSAEADALLNALTAFCHVQPRLPEYARKQFAPAPTELGIDVAMSRAEILARLESLRGRHPYAEMTFYAYRDLGRTDALPFLIAALQRNPVGPAATRPTPWDELVRQVREMPDESIYDEPGRLAQPDEVWNFGRGDGLEKALLLANIARARHADRDTILDLRPERALLQTPDGASEWAAAKQLRPQKWIFRADGALAVEPA